MRTKTGTRRVRFPAPHEDSGEEPVGIVFDEDEDAPSNEFIVMSQERHLPALQEHLRELGLRTIH